mmetsp:Transcript_52830/g.136824  ORF Transcript_52830/g.136824 Transcript_52830/m.136824 type:complete len:106 (-) Transcript_52830:365-682(-)
MMLAKNAGTSPPMKKVLSRHLYGRLAGGHLKDVWSWLSPETPNLFEGYGLVRRPTKEQLGTMRLLLNSILYNRYHEQDEHVDPSPYGISFSSAKPPSGLLSPCVV